MLPRMKERWRPLAAPTFCILGCGVDVTYPDRHGPLFRAVIAATGGLCRSTSRERPRAAGQFPARNRIIAALGDAVVCGGGRYRSGALITAIGADGGQTGAGGPQAAAARAPAGKRGRAWPVHFSDADVEEALPGASAWR